MSSTSTSDSQVYGQSDLKTMSIKNDDSWPGWIKVAILFIVMATVVGVVAYVSRDGKSAKSAAGSVHKAADDGGAAVDKTASTPAVEKLLDLGPLNTSLSQLNTTLSGLGDSVADKVGEKLEENNRTVVEKLDLLLAQKTAQSDPPASSDDAVGDDGVAKEPCPPEEEITIDDRVVALEQWRTGVDQTLGRHGRAIRRINRRIKNLGNVPIAELPGVAPTTSYAVVTHLKYDK
jgi:hypothetical protein